MHTVVLAGGPTLVRAAVAEVVELSGSMTVVGQTVGHGELRDLLRTDGGPHAVLLDRSVRLDGALDLPDVVTVAAAAARTLVLGVSDIREADACLRAGATGVLAPGVTAAQLTGAMETVLAGGLVVVLETAPALEAHARQTVGSRVAAPLSGREREILTLLATGQEGSAIAHHLNLSPLTVKTHIANMLTKLGARHRGQLISYAYENGIVVPGATPLHPFVGQLAEAS
ncbi:DNA-binding response regulator [Streptomyces malachitofuscus]|nr:DNA-binding response regulator [Streptomyces malachitofuscus]